ncbi:hypothetical protein SAMN04488546_4571 [Geodermatophilus poikilotrophus]|uniref:Uncharacterized protein n=2 Tax=Geodermatophilus poikilotrophus TaxID=1333667 RepID=A0A1I0IRF4_9ACTN|nr:hypothetical protein SAMN04488546_4571 [Geodermatophilus poikilotrophus]
MTKWWRLQEPGDALPFAVAYMGDDFLIRRFVPGEGLVYWPSLVMWTHGDEMGAEEISEGRSDPDDKGRDRAVESGSGHRGRPGAGPDHPRPG